MLPSARVACYGLRHKLDSASGQRSETARPGVAWPVFEHGTTEEAKRAIVVNLNSRSQRVGWTLDVGFTTVIYRLPKSQSLSRICDT